MTAAFKFDEESMIVVRDLSMFHGIPVEDVLSKAVGLMRIEALYGPLYIKTADGKEQLITLGGIDEIHEDQVPEQEQG